MRALPKRRLREATALTRASSSGAPLVVTRIVRVGKESNQLEELEAGTVHDGEELLEQYVSPRWDPWDRLVRRRWGRLERGRWRSAQE